jgi:streptomycin 6-kinase
VLKIAVPHFEGMHEIAGLRFWAGDPTVRLLESDEGVGGMLLERCEPGTSLRAEPEAGQDVEIARLLRRLWRSPPVGHPFRPLSEMLAHWADEALAKRDSWRDPGLVSAGLELFHELSRAGAADLLLATDLHAGNVLRAEREHWLVLDPKPFVGDPAYDATQHLLNCRGRLRADPGGTVRRFADLLEVNHEAVRAWTFARLAVESSDEAARGDAGVLARRLEQ